MTLICKPGETVDAFLNGRLRIIQSQKGYRFSIDALLLADFVMLGDEDIVVDLGAGCGIISLLLAIQKKPGFIVGLELQDELASQAQRNVALNELEEKITVIQGDLRHLPLLTGFADIVVCNPPYRTAQSGRITVIFCSSHIPISGPNNSPRLLENGLMSAPSLFQKTIRKRLQRVF